MTLSFPRLAGAAFALALAAFALPATSGTAEAGGGYRYSGYGHYYYDVGGYYRRPYYRHGYRHYGHPYRYRRHYGRHYGRHYDSDIAAGIIGLAAGAIISGALTQPRYYNYRRPHHANTGWVGSRAWLRYCRSKYRSFDARTGTFQPYNGPRRLCR